jgi:hypothetical protein
METTVARTDVLEEACVQQKPVDNFTYSAAMRGSPRVTEDFDSIDDLASAEEGAALIRAFTRIKHRKMRTAIIELAVRLST